MRSNPADGSALASASMCETLESRRLLSGVFVSRPDNFDADLGANVLAGHVAIGNINTDGNLDIAITSDGGTSFDFLLGNGNGNFQPASTVYNAGDDPGPPVIADMNNDLASDIVLSNTTQNNISILFNDGDNHFSNRQTIVVGTGPGALAVGDFNDDQNLDIAVLNEGDRVSVLLGNGNGTFQPQGNFDVDSDPDSIALADVNKDGKLDIVTANAGDDTISVLLGDGGGGFSDQKVFDTGAAPTSIAVADFNNDNKLDVAVTDSQSDSVNVLLGNGKGAFNPPSTFVVLPEPQQLVAADFNGDGKQDIATLSRFTPQVSVLLGKGNGSFLATSNFIANPGAGFSMTVGNIEGGNRPVLVTANEILGTVSEMFTSAPSTAPTLLSPADGAKSAASPQLVWSSSDEFPSRVIVAANKADLPTDPSSTASIPSAIIDTTTGNTSITIPAKLVQGNTKYFWEVQFEKGGYSEFSSIGSFVTPDTKPAIAPLSSPTIQAGQTYSASDTFTDNDAGDSWTALVNYGDGSKTAALALHGHKFALSHLYSKIGNFEVVVQVTDSHGAAGVDKFHVGVITPIKSVAFAKWTSHTAGKLDTFNYSMTNSNTDGLVLDSADLSTSDFSLAPGSATQTSLDYAVSDDWSITFSAAVPRLLLDVKFWRGSAADPTSGSFANYTFNTPFTIISGVAGGKASGNTLSLPASMPSGQFFDGILEFDNVKTLSLTNNINPMNDSAQVLNFSEAK